MPAKLAASALDRCQALEKDRDHEEGGRRTEEGDEIPLRADTDVPDLPEKSPGRSRTADDPRDDEGDEREEHDAEKPEGIQRDVRLQDPEALVAQQ